MDRYVHDAILDMGMARTELEAALGQVGPDDWSRQLPYGSRTLHDLLAHIAAADQVWAQAARELLASEAEAGAPLTPAEAKAAQLRAVERRRAQTPGELIEEMTRRRRLLLSLYELLEPRHLAVALRSFGERHNSVREHIWLGYHDRLHAADVNRALRMTWHAPKLECLPSLQPIVEALSPDPTLYVIYSVDPVQWERPSPVPGWSYRQLLSHIATGDWVLQAHLATILERGTVGAWPDLAEGNAARIEARAHTTHRALTEEYLSMRHETLLLLSRLEPQHLELGIDLWWEPPPNERSVLDYLLRFPRHDQGHREQLRPAMRYLSARRG